MSDTRISVCRDAAGKYLPNEWEVQVGFEGRYRPATRLDPEEWPEPVPRAAWRDGQPVDLKEVPDTVIEEACRLAEEADGDDPEPEQDDGGRDEDDPYPDRVFTNAKGEPFYEP